MPLNKYPFARHRVIDRLLGTRDFVKTKEMVEACLRELNTKVTQRTIENDLDFMMADPPVGYGAPIENDSSRKAYYYREAFSLNHFKLNKDELAVLELSASLIYQFRDLGFLKHVSTAIEKVKWGVSMTGKAGAGESLAAKVRPETVDGLEWQHFFATAMNALEGHFKLRLEYQKFDDEESSHRIVHPYLLKEYQNRWYLVGYCEYRKTLRSFGLDRVISMDVIDETLPEPIVNFDPDTYYQHVFGVTASPDPPVEILLEFKAKAGKYIQTVPLHGSQKVLAQTTDTLLISINVYPTYEVFQKILSYGSEVRVLGPKSVIKKIKRSLTAAAKQYKNKFSS